MHLHWWPPSKLFGRRGRRHQINLGKI
jgi:hypothetical protein